MPESQQLSLARELRDKYELRKPWPEMVDASGPLCNQSADVVVVYSLLLGYFTEFYLISNRNDFVNFANRYDSISAAVGALRCAAGRVIEQFSFCLRTNQIVDFAIGNGGER